VKSEKTVIARQRLVETFFRYDGELKHVFMATTNNKGMNCCTRCSTSGPLEASSGRDIESRDRGLERENSRGLRMDDSIVEMSKTFFHVL
jgi:hypothetical protein